MKRGWKTRDRFISQTWTTFLIGVVIIVCLLNNTVYSVQVPDTKGTRFVFSTPSCSETSPAKLLVVPQTTIAVNVTIVSLEDNNTLFYDVIEADDSLQYILPCTTVKWGSIVTSGYLLTSSDEVSVYIHNNNDNCMVFPNDTHGTSYIISNIVTTVFPTSFIIIHGNHSRVSLTLPANFVTSTVSINGVQYSTGSTINLTLPENGMLGLNCSCDYTGAMIQSSRPISVFVGSYSNITFSGVMEQLVPTSSWGKRHLFSMSSWFHPNVTLKIAGSSLNTMLSIETKGSMTSSTFTNSPYLTIQLVANDFISVAANETVLCVVMYKILDQSNTYHLTMKFVPPLELFHISLMFTLSLSTTDDSYSNIIAHSESFEYITFNHHHGDPFNGAMTFYWEYYLCQGVYLTSPRTIRTNNLNTSPYIGSVITRSTNSAYEYSLGMRIADLYDACVETRTANGGNGDGIDNDCDNKIDEEKLNNVDDDNDGLIDEDVLYFGKVTNTQVDAWTYHQTHKEDEKEFSRSFISVIISIVVALTSVGVFIAGMLIAERVRRSGSTRITPIYLEQQQQEPILQRY